MSPRSRLIDVPKPRQRQSRLTVLAGTLAAIVAMALTGCSTASTTNAAGTPATPITTTTSASTSAPTSSNSSTASTDLVASAVTGFGQTAETGTSVYLFANGRTLATNPQAPWGFDEFTVSSAQVQTITQLATQLDLLQLRDAGEPLITDQDTRMVSALGPLGVITQRVYAPGFDDPGLTSDQRATRKDIETFVAALRALSATPQDKLIEATHAYLPSSLRVRAYPVLPEDPDAEQKPAAVPATWGATQSVTATFATDACIQWNDKDAEWFRGVESTRAGTSSRRIVVASSVQTPQLLTLEAEPLETSVTPCYEDRPPLAETTWPAETTEESTPFDQWLGQATLYRYAYEGKLTGLKSPVDYLDTRFARVTEGGKTLVDLAASNEFGSTNSFRVAMRIDPASGTVTRLEVAG
jgi:hypothetical protein